MYFSKCSFLFWLPIKRLVQLQTQSHKAKAEESRQELIPVSGPATQEREAAAGGGRAGQVPRDAHTF